MRYLFGWGLPPGVSNHMIEEQAGAFEEEEMAEGMEKLVESIAERMFGDVDEYTREIARASVKDVLSAVRDGRLDEELGVVGRRSTKHTDRNWPFWIDGMKRRGADVLIALRKKE